MNYSVQNLTQVADCDVLLGWAQTEKAALDHKRYSEQYQSTKVTQTVTEIFALLQAFTAEIAIHETMIAGLPDGPVKAKRIFEKTKLEHKVFLLEHRKASYGIVAQLEQEMELGRVEQELEEVATFIAEVTAHRARLVV